MDKGIKGLLTGDLSVFLIRTIQVQIADCKKQFEDCSNKIQDLLVKQQNMAAFYKDNFQVAPFTDSMKQAPSYEIQQNLESQILV